ncbi:dienelactone hydrolase family protein [Balneolaceae bacterium YR4-1]|uniref:Dienelactone hydrolase family protein n=1 Tax=Halalkalibaculum roseum TaxID=2709311 RepID=A0A6M1T265_9BACT|nr:dienelactone hydrolase family protein [Halalkalibaculum roseum]NGP76125.1 dienelactone hydrolase family protein [Halalkalibaculum roseum]
MKSILLSLLALLLTLEVSAQDYATEQLENSPRHHEWVTMESSGRVLHTFVAYPERSDNAPVVLVIHENRGLNDWARSFADQLAAAGYIAVAPDLISNTVEGIQKTSDFKSSDAAREAIYALDPDMVTTDLLNVLDYARSIDAGDGTVAVAGFCWGGSQSFRFATNAGDSIDAALVFYGTGPESLEDYQRIEVPVYGFYGGDDQRVNATIENSEMMMEEAGNTYDYKIYEGAGHAYMRRGDDPDAPKDDPNVIARNQSWERLKSILNNL